MKLKLYGGQCDNNTHDTNTHKRTRTHQLMLKLCMRVYLYKTHDIVVYMRSTSRVAWSVTNTLSFA